MSLQINNTFDVDYAIEDALAIRRWLGRRPAPTRNEIAMTEPARSHLSLTTTSAPTNHWPFFSCRQTSHGSTSPFHAAAQALSERGCAVIPCKPRAKVPVLLRRQNLVLSEAAIDAWWEYDPQQTLVGFATGGSFGFIVVDIEMKKGLNGRRDLPAGRRTPATARHLLRSSHGKRTRPHIISAPIVRSAVATLPMALRSRCNEQ